MNLIYGISKYFYQIFVNIYKKVRYQCYFSFLRSLNGNLLIAPSIYIKMKKCACNKIWMTLWEDNNSGIFDIMLNEFLINQSYKNKWTWYPFETQYALRVRHQKWSEIFELLITIKVSVNNQRWLTQLWNVTLIPHN